MTRRQVRALALAGSSACLLAASLLGTGALAWRGSASGNFSALAGVWVSHIPAECLAAGLTSFPADHTKILGPAETKFEAPEHDAVGWLIIGNALANELEGGDGRDCISGGGGNDDIEGEGGNDVLLGGPGDDEIEGGAGNDTIDGGPGADHCEGNGGANTIASCGESNSGATGAPSPSPSPSATPPKVTIVVVPPAAPTGLTAAVTPNRTVTLTWAPVEGVAYYNIYRSDTQGSLYEGIGSAHTPTFLDTQVKPGNVYYYVVTAVSQASVQSASSNEAAAAIPLPTKGADAATPTPAPASAPAPASTATAEPTPPKR